MHLCCLLLLEVKFKVISTGYFSKLLASVESSLGAMVGYLTYELTSPLWQGVGVLVSSQHMHNSVSLSPQISWKFALCSSGFNLH